MPRKPRLPSKLVIQGLSDGQIVADGERDDFTGEPITIHIAQPPKRELASGWEIRERQQRIDAKAKRAMLERIAPELLGLPPNKARPKLAAPEVAGMRPAGTIKLKDGKRVAWYVPKDPIRRI